MNISYLHRLFDKSVGLLLISLSMLSVLIIAAADSTAEPLVLTLGRVVLGWLLERRNRVTAKGAVTPAHWLFLRHAN